MRAPAPSHNHAAFNLNDDDDRACWGGEVSMAKVLGRTGSSLFENCGNKDGRKCKGGK